LCSWKRKGQEQPLQDCLYLRSAYNQPIVQIRLLPVVVGGIVVSSDSLDGSVSGVWGGSRDERV
jgi:hypothetical protein